MTEVSPAPVIEPSRVGRFRAGFVICMTVVVVAFAGLALTASEPAARKSGLCFLLTPVVLFLAARWVASAETKGTLFRRAVLAHIGALFASVVLLAVARSGDPGFSGHGGVFLLMMVALPFCGIGGAIIGLLGALAGRMAAGREA